jgi:predicted hydrocarbon binding protein
VHGTIFVELKKYVDTKFGGEAWVGLLKEAGLSQRSYDAFETYPDEEAGRLVATASRVTGADAAAILEDFGEFIAPDLLEMYWALVQPEWKTLDVIEHTESAIHEVVRLKNPGAQPPRLRVERQGPDALVLTYTSERKMCKVAEGIAKGLARHFGERIAIDQATCMLRGDSECSIRVRRLGTA